MRDLTRTPDSPPGEPTLGGAMLSPSEIGSVNRALVLQALWDHGPMSRAELARLGGVTRATIGNIVNELIDVGLVVEAEPRQTGRAGKPGRPVWFVAGAGRAGAVALGAGTCRVAVVDAQGSILEAVDTRFDPTRSGPADVVGAVASAWNGLGESTDGVLGVGVAVPGVVDPATGIVLGSGQIPGIEGARLGAALGERLGLAVAVDNDARTQALGEKWFGDGRAVATFASLQTGDGLGMGFVLDGTVLRGVDGNVGEIGHTCVDHHGARCRCGLVGCWETIATLGWLRREAESRGLPEPADMDAARLVEAAANDARARTLLEEYVDNLAVGLANLVQLLRPRRLILHGDVTGGGGVVRAMLVDAVARRTHRDDAAPTDVVFSSLGPDAALVGAAGLVWAEEFRLQV